MSRRLPQWLDDQPAALGDVISALAIACQDISAAVSLGPLSGLHGDVGKQNAFGESRHPLDLFADRCIAGALAVSGHVAGWTVGRQGLTDACPAHAESGEYLIAFASLDGSANAEASVGLGTIFSVMRHPFRGTPPGEAGFLQPGRRQVAAGYVVYGPATVMVLSCGAGVAAFTLDRRERDWRLTSPSLRIPEETRDFSINVSNQRFWEKPVQRYVAECLAGSDGPRAEDFNMRWVASLVAEVHRIVDRGGVFLCPRDNRQPKVAGTLCLVHEAAPMAFLVEQAGGAAVTGTQALLDIVPDTLHQKVPVVLGSKREVERIVRYHADPHENTHWPLFKERSLFVPPAG